MNTKYILISVFIILIAFVLINIAFIYSQSNINSKNTGLLFDEDRYEDIKTKAGHSGYVSKAIIPAYADWSDKMPPIGEQGTQNSCVAWAVATYRSFQEKLEQGWDYNESHMASPSFIYNTLNKGKDNGIFFEDALGLLATKGCLSLKTMAYDKNDYRKQPPRNYAKWYKNELEMFQIEKYDTLTNKFGNLTDGDIDSIKLQLYYEGPLLIGAILSPEWESFIENDRNFLIDDYEGIEIHNSFRNKKYTGHAMVVVGYNDEYRYDPNIEDYIGAFKIMNSWGDDWGNEGYLWMSYEAFKKSVFTVYIMVDKPYNPAKVEKPVELGVLVKQKGTKKFEEYPLVYNPQTKFFSLEDYTFNRRDKFILQMITNDNYSVYFVNITPKGDMYKVFPSHFDDKESSYVTPNLEYSFPDERGYTFATDFGRELFIVILSQSELTDKDILAYKETGSTIVNEDIKNIEDLMFLFPKIKNRENIVLYALELRTKK